MDRFEGFLLDLLYFSSLILPSKGIEEGSLVIFVHRAPTYAVVF